VFSRSPLSLLLGAMLAALPAAVFSAAAADANRIAKDGVAVEFSMSHPAAKGSAADLVEDQLGEVRFRITETATGKPVQGITPAAWLDMAQNVSGREGQQKACKDKIALYLKGIVGIRPMVDLNSYYVLVMNREPSISVVDPLVSMAGRTSTLANIRLKHEGADWVRSADTRRVFITMPQAGAVATIEIDGFKTGADVPAGSVPTRIALQPDGRYLWVGNNAREAAKSGVTVIDAESLKVAGFIATGKGHHEIAFSPDSRHAFVTNRDDATLSVIDVRKLKKVSDLKTGEVPISVAYSTLSRTVYVAAGKDGAINTFNGETFAAGKPIALKPGLGPIRFSPDGRWLMALNTATDRAHVIDPATNEVVNTIETGPQPYQIGFTPAFAYVRSLGSERVGMINLSSIGPGKKPIFQTFAAGSVAPKLAGNLPIADAMSMANNEAAFFVVNPSDNTTYFYMEGMNAPMSNYKVMGSSARAVMTVSRSLKEVEPGVYAAPVRVPVAGHYDVAFQLTNPRLLHCFTAEAKPNPALRKSLHKASLEYLNDSRKVTAGETYTLRFRLADSLTGKPREGLKDVLVRYYRVPGKGLTTVVARETEAGVYEAKLPIPEPGAYVAHVASASAKFGFQDLPYFTLTGAKPGVAKKTSATSLAK